MEDKDSNLIGPNTKCKIIKDSPFFLNKYGDSRPNIVIEDRAEVIFDDKEWWKNFTNPAIATFLLRSVTEGINPEEKTVKAYYGKITNKDGYGLGEIVWEDEIERDERE